MKPGKRDVKVNVLIQGDELDALQDISGYFTECFGLDDRIYNYKGVRPLGLYSWDFDCLIAGIEDALESTSPYLKLSPTAVRALSDLLIRIKALDAEAYPQKAGSWE
ncbi:hypothetical protein [Thiothrix nivea]|uniref:Uncharacterized protein n=1 Tax=Thiothrix nivea (strain ATCC 35100 / DSM 5205 / JP2) TaxID=870187 RepID=A0A656HIP7_THINJ|nr:hypothetical protein [Thiothrix nivea]EIJ35366.1 hypothetical protein Thini_2831 [Thiothrix nivea DSM 5205]